MSQVQLYGKDSAGRALPIGATEGGMSVSDGMALGGSGPRRLTGTSAITGNFKIFDATNGDVVINTLSINGVSSAVWNGYTIKDGRTLYFGKQTVTSITLTSGSLVGYEQ